MIRHLLKMDIMPTSSVPTSPAGTKNNPYATIIIGAGPAGLTAGYILARAGRPPLVLEADPERVGGISRTEWRGPYGFDIGGHRFFSKSAEVNALWDELLPEDMLERQRSSRIYYRRRLFAYPIRPLDALLKLGPLEALRCVVSYGQAKLRPIYPVRSFEDWTVNAFGRRLFSIFFKTYTEKVWGMPTDQISADWAAQRIKGLSLGRAIFEAFARSLPGHRADANGPKTLLTVFRYPRRGPGMMWEQAARRIGKLGGELRLGQMVVGLRFLGEVETPTARWIVRVRNENGDIVELYCRDVISSAPLALLWPAVEPLPASAAAARALSYRDFITVALVLHAQDAFPDNWIYIHEPDVLVGRIQNFRSWSPELVPDNGVVCYGMEYFCFAGDELWTRDDADLVTLASTELEQLGLGRRADFLDGFVVRQARAYPIYDDGYAERVALIREEIKTRYPGLHLAGRNGMHRYNNQDHAMMTGAIAAENILAGRLVRDPWSVNEDAEYHEDRGETGSRAVPRRV